MDFAMADLETNLKYPKCVWLVVLNELCERFSYFGLRTVLVLYLTTILQFNGDESTIIYHSFVFLAYFMPLPGAILADSCWGKFNTIMRLSMVYVLGNLVLTGASMANMFSLDFQKIISLIGLFFISVGTGGIKPCVLPFGGDQFQLPQQHTQLRQFITNFTIAINVGALASSFLTPELRHDVHCFGRDSCFPLAFGVPAVLMIVATAIFVSGKRVYTRKKPERDVISRTFSCIFYALRMKVTSSAPAKTHWLDNAKGVYSETEISDTRAAMNVIAVFTTFPVFWALYEQQGSRWTLQATLMDGRLDFLDWTIKPDQMQTIIPFFGLIFLVLFNVILYPLLAKVGINKPLQKLTLSGLLAIVAFIFAALVQFKISGSTTVIPPEEASVNIYNGFDCDVQIRSTELHVDYMGPLEMINVSYTPKSREDIVRILLKFNPKCSFNKDNFELDTTLTFVQGQVISYYLTRSKSDTISLIRVGNYDSLIKDKHGNPKIRFLMDYKFDFDQNVMLNGVDENSLVSYSSPGKNYSIVKPGKYNLLYNGKILSQSVNLIPATFYTIILQQNENKTDVRLFSVDEGNYIHILWQLPQFLSMIMADVMFVVTTIEFAYIEAPMNISSFVNASNLLTTAIGNLLVVLISIAAIQNQAYEYLLYSGIMFADTLLLAYFSVVYQSRNITADNNSGITNIDENKKEEDTVI